MINIRPLSKELQEIACSELNEVPERVSQDLEHFKEWLNKQPHLKVRMDDQILISFLRGCKYSLEKAKLKIDSYYTLKTKYPDFFTIQNPDDPKVKEVIKLGMILMLPVPLNNIGPRVVYLRTKPYPLEKFTVSDINSVPNGFQELDIRDDDYGVICGFILLINMSEFSTAHAMQITPTIAKRIVTFIEHAAPLRNKSIHILNTPPGLDKVINMFKIFMSPEQQKRLFVHGNDLSSLHKHIPQKYLPQDLGGENGTIEEIIEKNLQRLDNNREYFLEGHNYRVDETLRRDKVNDYGIEGSFRKLNVD